MEYLIGLAVLVGLGYWFFNRSTKPADAVQVEDAPYKVETPVVAEAAPAAPAPKAKKKAAPKKKKAE